MQKLKNKLGPILIALLILLIIGFGLFQFIGPSSPGPRIPVTGGKVVPSATPIAAGIPVATRIVVVPLVITATPASTLAVVCNQAAFVQDITIPDGTQVTAGSPFQKIWRLQNTGSCIWTPNYQIVFDKGDILGAPGKINLPGNVNPGQTVDIPVSLAAPTANGSYAGHWKLMDPNGTVFGTGSGGNSDFFVKISVIDALPPFRVSHVIMSVDNSSVKANCAAGFPFTLTAIIEASQPGDITYHWQFSNGQDGNETTLTIGDSLSQTVTLTVIPKLSGTYWARIVNDEPNHQTFSQVFFTLTCQ